MPIIAISGGGRGSPAFYLAMAREFGADVTLQKPFSKAQILEAVEDLIMEGDRIQEA